MIKILYKMKECAIFRIIWPFIPFLQNVRHRNILTMLHGKLERGPEEVVPREVMLFPLRPRNIFLTHTCSSVSYFNLIYFYKCTCPVYSLNQNKVNKIYFCKIKMNNLSYADGHQCTQGFGQASPE